jgi:hypothetical protein
MVQHFHFLNRQINLKNSILIQNLRNLYTIIKAYNKNKLQIAFQKIISQSCSQKINVNV